MNTAQFHRYSDYNGFAWIYNKHWGEMFFGKALSIIEKLVLPDIPQDARILDVCCGTGQLARALIERGYRITGIDGSEEMIRFARENAPEGEFIVEDGRYFRLPDRYDAVVSTFDSLNHVMSLEDLRKVFHNVYEALVDGGVFMFDMNMAEAYKSDWKDSFAIVEDDHVCVVRSSYSVDERIGKTEITIFLLEGGWRRSDLTLLQKCYCEREILSALACTGFADIQPYDAERGLGDIQRRLGRTFFLCRKPGATISD